MNPNQWFRINYLQGSRHLSSSVSEVNKFIRYGSTQQAKKIVHEPNVWRTTSVDCRSGTYILKIYINLIEKFFKFQFLVVPHWNAFESKWTFAFNFALRLIMIAFYVASFFASVYYDKLILSKNVPLILKIGI